MTVAIIIGAVAVIFLVFLFLIAPSARKEKTAEFFADKKHFAHRGLHGAVPENSLAAFRLAVENGYGIELDLHVTADGKLCVFHDNTLTRMCNIDGRVEDKTAEELHNIRLGDSEEYIPLFSEVLALVDGKVPLVVELKGESGDTRVCELAAEMLDGYKGEYCMESFNPIYVGWFKKHRPDVIRGQLSARMTDGKGAVIKLRNFALKNMLTNVISRPDFLAYCYKDKDVLAFRLARKMGGYPVAWTVRDDEAMQSTVGDFKAVIFENIDPGEYEL